MILGIGSDICSIKRIENAYEKFGSRFIDRCFGDQEKKELQKLLDNKQKYAASLAKRFAAKEAFVKAIGTGFNYGIAWNEIEVIHHQSGKPMLSISGKAEEYLLKLEKQNKIWLSLSDDYPWAQAVVVIEAN